MIIKLMIILLN